VTGIEALVAASAAYGFKAVGEIITIDAGPNRGQQGSVPAGPRPQYGRVYPERRVIRQVEADRRPR
jgi:hypothetical protein